MHLVSFRLNGDERALVGVAAISFARAGAACSSTRAAALRSVLRCRVNYQALNRAGHGARYNEQFSLTEQKARELLDVDFRRVEATVMQALGQPVPAW